MASDPRTNLDHEVLDQSRLYVEAESYVEGGLTGEISSKKSDTTVRRIEKQTLGPLSYTRAFRLAFANVGLAAGCPSTSAVGDNKVAALGNNRKDKLTG